MGIMLEFEDLLFKFDVPNLTMNLNPKNKDNSCQENLNIGRILVF